MNGTESVSRETFSEKAIVFDPFPRLRYKAASEGFDA
jgi:hypothetical protein